MGKKHSVFRPVLSMAATLIVGLAVGYSLPAFQVMMDDDRIDDYSELLYGQDDLL